MKKSKIKRAALLATSAPAREPVPGPPTERLTAAAILRAGHLHSNGFKSHGEIRGSLGDADPYASHSRPGDTAGFLTSSGRFVTRAQAVPVAVESGQLGDEWLSVGRELLSSDINWEGVKP